MRVLFLDGTLDDSRGSTVQQALQTTLQGAEITAFSLREVSMAYCLGCFGCWVRTPGECVIDDAGREIARAAVRCDLLVLLTPVTFGGYSSALKRAVDRLIPNIMPFFTTINGETHHVKRYPDYPRLAAIGIGDGDADTEQVFARLVQRNALNLHAPAHASRVAFGDQDLLPLVQDLLTAVGVLA